MMKDYFWHPSCGLSNKSIGNQIHTLSGLQKYVFHMHMRERSIYLYILCISIYIFMNDEKAYLTNLVLFETSN